MNKINYHKQLLETIDSLDYRPKLLLHACCGVCLAYPLNFLKEKFDITIYYYNSNIYPETEYHRRYNEMLHYLKVSDNTEIKVVEATYDNPSFNKVISKYADEKEGGKRCSLCFDLRLEASFKYANEHNFDYITTIMTVSRHKNSQVINQIGFQLSKKYPNTDYLYSDFKKDNGTLKGSQIADSFNLYRQDYCGCIYSYKEKLKREKLKAQELNP